MATTLDPKFRAALEAAVYRDTHRDFKGKFSDGTRTVCQYVNGKGTCLMPLSALSDMALILKVRWHFPEQTPGGPTHLPRARIGRQSWFWDARLSQLRDIDAPHRFHDLPREPEA